MTFSSTSTEGRYSVSDGLRLRRWAFGAVVVVVHVGLILVIGRGGGIRRAGEALENAFFPLPITLPEEERPQKETPAPFETSAQALELASSAVAPPVFPEISEPAEPAGTSTTAIDWQAELGTAAGEMDERARAERDRRSFSGPPPHASLARKGVKRACPFEQCEPGWDAAPSVFDSTATKKGRIEQRPDGEVIRWISNNCYQILITPNEMHRAMTMCFKPLGKNTARGDLFDHMRDVPVPEERAVDVP